MNRRSHMAQFEIDPQTALLDQLINIKVVELTPNSNVVIRLHFQDDLGQSWSSYAKFVADDTGVVDLHSAQPVEGDYKEPGPMAIFWAVHPQAQAGVERRPFLLSTTHSLKQIMVQLTAEINGLPVATASLTRRFYAETVERTDINQPELVATLFRPSTGDSRGVAITLGGSGGGFGWSRQVAALLASYGQTAMAVAYFDWIGQNGLPRELVEIPLETVEKAIAYLRADATIGVDMLTLLGYSKGAELALLAATRYADIRRVVAFMPSNVVWEGVSAQPTNPHSSWSYAGDPLPFIPNSMEGNYYTNMVNVIEQIEQSKVLVTPFADALIPVEKVGGPILLISATADPIWPSATMADLIIKRLQRRQHPFEAEHLCLQNVGHALGIPYLPYLPIGATEVANMATAAEQVWRAVKQFMDIS